MNPPAGGAGRRTGAPGDYGLTRRELVMGATAAALACSAPSSAAAASPDDRRALDLLARISEELLADYPDNACSLGLDTQGRRGLRARFTDRSRAGVDERAVHAAKRLAQLEAMSRRALSAGVKLHCDVALSAFRTAVDGWRVMPVGTVETLNSISNFRSTPFVVSQLTGAYIDLPTLLEQKHEVRDAADAEAYLARLDATAAAVAGETERMREDGSRGAILPGFLNDLTVKQISAMTARRPEDWTSVTSFGVKCARAGVSGRYTAEAAQIVADRLVPAMNRQAQALAGLRQGAGDEVGMWRLRGGDAYYGWLMRAATTTTMGVEELHALGLAETARLTAKMDVLLRARGLSTGTVGERMSALSRQPELLFANDDSGREQLIAYLRQRIDDVRARLPRAFDRLVSADIEIARVPPAIQDGAPSGYASPGSANGAGAGIYSINLRDTTIWPRYALPTLCYHEAIPGHLWQHQFDRGLPLIRRLIHFNAFSEGWALYAEQLADELGVYEHDPLGELGYLQSINFRACRLVVDTGIHAKRWSFGQALDWLQGATGIPRAKLASEIARYAVVPAQACGYTVGYNEINRQRDHARDRLGSAFDLPSFDDTVMAAGNVPLPVLATVIDAHVAARARHPIAPGGV